MEYTYEVRRGGVTLMYTTHKDCRYPPQIVADMQKAGLDIYIDGKRQPMHQKRGRDD